jgi:hypothetical protein
MQQARRAEDHSGEAQHSEPRKEDAVMVEKEWHDCACGESICVPDSPFGATLLAQWKLQHIAHDEAESFETR